MADQYNEIPEKLSKFIGNQKIYFIASADDTGRVNLSPKGGDTFRVLGSNRVAWMSVTGSGNETAAHLLANNRITIMFCSFTENPMILRLYGSGRICYPGSAGWDELHGLFPDSTGNRQIFDVEVDLVQTSCGFQVPYFEYQGDRDTLEKWAEKKGHDGIREYWREKNRISLDGKPTGIPL